MIYLPQGFINQESKKVFLYILILAKLPFKYLEINELFKRIINEHPFYIQ